jgi:hypothetical protein
MICDLACCPQPPVFTFCLAIAKILKPRTGLRSWALNDAAYAPGTLPVYWILILYVLQRN